ncbi:MAG: DNA cytosine methyltransferase [Planctomycetales bacterium]|nr:DNA cytosine methyltransferase [Planctomycetales bacterium]
MSGLVLSLFPGVDLLGRAFAAAGFVVVTGPDRVTGGDVRDFAGMPGRFDGIIGGPPCQGFSATNMHRSNPRHKSVRLSREMLGHFVRIVEECRPRWFLCENVPAVPNVRVPGFPYVQRLPLCDWECGGVQIRTRHIQFGHAESWIIRPERSVIERSKIGRKPEAITTKPVSRWESYALHCRKQGLPESLALPGWTKEAKFRAVGNGVPLAMGRALAAAVVNASPKDAADCPCGCGRRLVGKQRASTASCRKRLQMMRDCPRDVVDRDGYHEFADPVARASTS